MSDLDRLAADLGAALGGEPIASLILPEDVERRRDELARLQVALESTPAVLVSVRDAELSGEDDGPSGMAAELERELRRAGLELEWLGLTDAAGSVGRRAGITALVGGTGAAAARELITAGPLGLRFDRAVDAARKGRARVCIASYEFVGPTRTGGIGTAYTSLAEALADEGHEVVVLFSGEEEHPGSLHEWTAHYRARGIELHGLPAHVPTPEDPAYRHQIRAHQVFTWLREAERRRGFDVIHFPEVLGHAYFAVRAKHQGLAFGGATIVLGAHSSTSWVLETNGALMQAQGDFIDDFCERESVAGADVLVSPSAYMLDWMRSKDWQVPERSFVQQYVRSTAVAELARTVAEAESPGVSAGPTEIVFFGRLEPRKGLTLFCDAVDRLAEGAADGVARVTFLGKESTIEGLAAGEYIGARAASWPWPSEIVSDLNQPQAVSYLKAPGARLTVIPSLADNSPNTVYEALALRLAFIASRVGGTAELIDPLDLGAGTFDPGAADDERSRTLGAARLAAKLRGALDSNRLDPPRPAVDAEICRRAHVDWHAAIAAAPGSAGASANGIPPASISACVIGTDPGLIARSRESLEGFDEVLTAASHGEANPSGELVLHLEAGVVLDPGAAARLAGALESAGGDLLVLPIGDADRADELLRLPTAGPAIAGLFRRSFGDSAFLVRASTLERLGGFDSRVAADVQAHVLLCRAAVEGNEIDVFAEVAARARKEDLRELEIVVPSRRIPALLELYANAPDAVLRQLPLLSQQVWTMVRLYEENYSHLYRYRFGRLSVQVRFFVHKYRQLQGLWRRLRATLKRGPKG